MAQVPPSSPWYVGLSRFHWLVLLAASLGWIFDVFEGQIFVASMQEAMGDLLPAGSSDAERSFYNNLALALFLLGGAAGGVGFGRLADRLGRVRTLVMTILTYSLCTGLSALVQAWWQLLLCRFLVALGVGGEWAVATALVAEVFPLRARAWSLALFHASSVLGTLLAAAAGAVVVGNPSLGWRWGFVVGAGPALLVGWMRWVLREPVARPAQTLESARPAESSALPGLGHLFCPPLRRHTLVGVGLAAVGLATFWGTHIYGKDRLRHLLAIRVETTAGEVGSAERAARGPVAAVCLKRWEMLGMVLVTVGGGLGLVCFGPLSERLGRRGAFAFYHLGGGAAAGILFLVLSSVPAVLLFLPLFGFLTLGLHAGYAVYFPELFPQHLRSTGTGLCFNAGRLAAAPVLVLSGWLQRTCGWSLEEAAAGLSALFLLGLLLLLVAPETQGQELPA